MREVLRQTVLTREHDCAGSRVFAIAHELRRAGGSVHSARAAFERALAGPAEGHGGGCGASAELWRCYVHFCHQHRRQLRPNAAREVFYRAVGRCPWSRELIMEAFTTLAGELAPSELGAVFNTISSKGLRVHIDLDEFVEKWHKGGQ